MHLELANKWDYRHEYLAVDYDTDWCTVRPVASTRVPGRKDDMTEPTIED